MKIIHADKFAEELEEYFDFLTGDGELYACGTIQDMLEEQPNVKDTTTDTINSLKDWVNTHYTVKNFPDDLAGNLYWGCAIGTSMAAYEIGKILGMELEEPKWGDKL